MTRPLILVTGAAGFTGRHFIHAALEKGYRCIAAGNHSGAAVEGTERAFRIDLADRAATFELLQATQPDYLLHLAAVSFVGHEDVAEFYLSNVVGTINLVDAAFAVARKPRKIVIASSANIYGNADVLPIGEATPPKPQNDYAVSKTAMEYAVSLRMQSGSIVLARPFNYTGVGQAPHFLVPKIVAAYAHGDASLELGNIDVSRDFSDVRDVAAAYLGLLASSFHSGVVNICSGRAVSIGYILAFMDRLAGYKLHVASTPALARTQEIPVLYGSDELLRSIIGDYRRHTFEDTLRWMYLNHREQ